MFKRSLIAGLAAAIALAGSVPLTEAGHKPSHRRGEGAAAALGIAAAALGLAAVASLPSRHYYGGDYYYYDPATGLYYRDAPRVVYVEPEPEVVYVEPQVVYRSAPEPWTDDWYAYCASKYRSFDPDTGTYMTYSGRRKLCR